MKTKIILMFFVKNIILFSFIGIMVYLTVSFSETYKDPIYGYTANGIGLFSGIVLFLVILWMLLNRILLFTFVKEDKKYYRLPFLSIYSRVLEDKEHFLFLFSYRFYKSQTYICTLSKGRLCFVSVIKTRREAKEDLLTKNYFDYNIVSMKQMFSEISK